MKDPTNVVTAFSRHRFREAVDAFAQDVSWTLVGGEIVRGKSAVVALCEQSQRDLEGVTTTWDAFRVADAGSTVVVESWATYVTANGDRSRVASCDLYDFHDGLLTGITSFTVEV